MLEYLHSNHIVYRDLKPENLIIEPDGFLKLIDMGTNKMLKRSNLLRTFTVLGSPHYLAPEIFQGKGYTMSVDFYSLGYLNFHSF
jgi:cGMP-dependent protein kinase